MKLREMLSVVGVMGLMFAVMAYTPYKTNAETELEIRNRVVQIDTMLKGGLTAGCTGTLLSHNYVLTNAHCFPNGTLNVFMRRINDQEFIPAVIVSSATKVDYALLHFDGIDKSTQVDFTKDWHIGEDIILYGNPGIRAFVIGHSRIVGYSILRTPLGKVRSMFVYPCNESAPGFSGSGIYNLKGEYLGTHELGEQIPLLYEILSHLAGEPKQGPLCFAIPAKEAMERNLDRPWRGYDMEDK